LENCRCEGKRQTRPFRGKKRRKKPPVLRRGRLNHPRTNERGSTEQKGSQEGLVERDKPESGPACPLSAKLRGWLRVRGKVTEERKRRVFYIENSVKGEKRETKTGKGGKKKKGGLD